MIKSRGGVSFTLLFILTFCVNLVVAADKQILYQNGSHIFTQENANELLELAEFLGRSSFKAKDKKALLAWSIEDYKSVPKKADIYYKDLANKLMPKIRVMKNDSKKNNYRADLYLGYVNLFNKHPEYRKSPDNFLAVIDRYNPPVREALLLQQRVFNSFQQQLKLNQIMFNQTMRIQQQAADNVSKAIRYQAARDSITIPGGTILYETTDRIYAKDYKGNKFYVPK